MKRSSRSRLWTMPVAVVLIFMVVQLSGAKHQTQGTTLPASDSAGNRKLVLERPLDRQLKSAKPPQPAQPEHPAQQPEQQVEQPAPLDRRSLQTSKQCFEAKGGQPDQQVCIFENLILYNGKLLYVTNDANDSVPAIKISWLKKFEGDDMFHASVANQSQLGFDWNTAQVEELPQVALLHQQHYSNFYHMFSEVAPSAHFILCKFLGDCTYTPAGRTQLLWIQERRPDIPPYSMLDSVTDTFKCISPVPIAHKDDPHMQGKVIILRRAVTGVSNEARAFPEWKEEHIQHYREPPKEHMVSWRQRMADCFGHNFTQAAVSTEPLRVLFINRHYREGRMILNQAELAHLIEGMPEVQQFPSLDVQLVYLNGDDSLRDQAALFWNASLLIWPHGATMALTTFLPRGAQAIEVIPWVEEEKARQAEWVQAIRESFSLDIDLYMVQNKERRRVMFNQDALLQYAQYSNATPEQKVALLERGECPPGVDPFVCPFWWNHWQASVNLDWATLEPAVKAALGKLAAARKGASAGGNQGALQGGADAEGAAQAAR